MYHTAVLCRLGDSGAAGGVRSEGFSEGLQPCERRDSLYRTNSQSTKLKQAFYAVTYYARDLRGARLLC